MHEINPVLWKNINEIGHLLKILPRVVVLFVFAPKSMVCQALI